MTTLTIPINAQKKKALKSRIKKEGITATFLINKLIDFYQNGNFSFELVSKSDGLVFEENKELGIVSDRLHTKLAKKFKNETFPSLEEQLDRI